MENNSSTTQENVIQTQMSDILSKLETILWLRQWFYFLQTPCKSALLRISPLNVLMSKRPNVQFQGFLLLRRREPLGAWTFKPTLPWLRHGFIFCKLPVKARFYGFLL